MRRLILAALLALSAIPAVAAEPCRPIAGLEPLLAPGTVLLFGEIHGTAEAPAFVADSACHAARSALPVVIALEQPLAGQVRVEAFLDSNGESEARRRLLAGPFWQSGYQDGRASSAMLELIDRVRRLRAGGSAAGVVLFDVGGAGGGQARDRGMAETLATLARGETRGVTLVLTGNLHSRTARGRPGRADFEPMGHLLSEALPDRVVSLNLAHGGGSAWICSPECGVAGLAGRRGERPWQVEIGDDSPGGHDGWYRVGPITASPPARLSAAEREAVAREAARVAIDTPAPAPEPSPPAPAPQGPLSPTERRAQGRWQGYDDQRGFKTWSLDVEGRTFRAEGSGEWFEGHMIVREDREPPWIDFVIDRCRCAYLGTTAEAVFGWDDDALLVAATAPGNPRPVELAAPGAQLIRFLRP